MTTASARFGPAISGCELLSISVVLSMGPAADARPRPPTIRGTRGARDGSGGCAAGLSGPDLTCAGWDAVRRAAELRRRRPAGGLDVSLRDTTFVVVDLETTGGRADPARPADRATRSPRSARSRCAAARCSANWPRWSTRGREHPAADRRSSPASPRRWCTTPRRSTRCCPRSSSSPAARCWSPTTPASTSASCAPPRSAATSPWPQPAGAVHRPAGPAGAHPRRGAQRAAGRRWPGCSARRTTADPPRARRRPRHRRRAARADRAGRQPGRAHLHRPAVLPARRHRRPSAASGCSPTHLPHRPGVYLFRGPGRRGALRRHRGESAPPGRPVLQRRRPARPDEGDGGAGHRGRPRRVRARPRGGGARTAAAGRARAALQPPVEVPAPLVVDHADRRGVPAAVDRARTASSDSASGPFRSRADAAETADLLARFTGLRTCTTRLAALGAARSACPEARAVAVPGRRAASPPHEYAPAPRRAADADRRARRRRAGGGASTRIGELAERGRYESAARLRDHAAAADRRRCGAGSGCARWPRSPSWSRPVRTATAAGTWR